MKKKIALVFGGKSAEHEVSVNSARNIAKAIDLEKFDLYGLGISIQGSWYLFDQVADWEHLKTLSDLKISKDSKAKPCSLIFYQGHPKIQLLQTNQFLDVHCAFPINHGTFGEDGCIQGYFKMVNLPFVGCDVFSSSLGMDKDFMKRVLTFAGIPNANFVVLKKNKLPHYDDMIKKIGTPFFIKPANMGSSVGVHKIKTETDYIEKTKEAFQYDHKLIAEEFIQGREIECSVKGNRWKAEASVCGEVVPKHEFYSYEAKYLDDEGASLHIPADLTQHKSEELRKLAVTVFETLACEGMARVDFFLKKSGEIFVNEINTLPGFTKISMYPKMWEAAGLSYTNLITNLIELALDKSKEDQQLNTTFLDLES
ncbi:MAG: D-alanine--D-alanine ligase family protein [Pseudobdellovibrionaceae bacterium]